MALCQAQLHLTVAAVPSRWKTERKSHVIISKGLAIGSQQNSPAGYNGETPPGPPLRPLTLLSSVLTHDSNCASTSPGHYHYCRALLLLLATTVGYEKYHARAVPATDNTPSALVPHKTSTWHAV